jgi:opacity protein-like surface antigen
LALTALIVQSVNAGNDPYGPTIYASVNAGYRMGSSNAPTTTEFTHANCQPASVPQVNRAGTRTVTPDGFVGGGQLGYNWQSGHFVLSAPKLTSTRSILAVHGRWRGIYLLQGQL